MRSLWKPLLFKFIQVAGIPTVSLISVLFLMAYSLKNPSDSPSLPIAPSPLSPPSQLPSPPSQSPSLHPPRPKLPAPVAENPPKSPETPKILSKTPKSPEKPLQTPTEVAYQAPSAPSLEIRVAILRDVPQTTLGVSHPAKITDRNGRILKTLSPHQGKEVLPQGKALQVGQWQLPPIIWVQPTEGELTYVGDRWYRGKILIVSQGNSLLVVNYVDLEQYLYSVVGSEMHPDAPMEALKAQAIAARSYALVHIIRPASSWYDLGNTQRWQVYKGLNSEYNTGHHAVNATAGQILSYQGGVVESLYAATDEIVARAHSGRGMSQTGAYDLARQGYDHQRILGHYYPGITLARVVVNQ